MKKLLLVITSLVLLTGCKGCFADYEQRKAGVKKVCPNCTFSVSERYYIAVDTSKQPNIVYFVDFKSGGAYYNAWDVDHLTRVQ